MTTEINLSKTILDEYLSMPISKSTYSGKDCDIYVGGNILAEITHNPNGMYYVSIYDRKGLSISNKQLPNWSDVSEHLNKYEGV